MGSVKQVNNGVNLMSLSEKSIENETDETIFNMVKFKVTMLTIKRLSENKFSK